MTRNGNRGVALLAEVATVLWEHKDLHCAPAVEEEDGLVTLTVTLHPVDTGEALEGLEVLHELTYLSGLATVRAFCDDYGIDAAALESLLPEQRQGRCVERYDWRDGQWVKGRCTGREDING